MVDTERYERLLEVLGQVDEASQYAPVIVEGKRDSGALRSMGVTGEVITLNRGVSVHEFCQQVLDLHGSVVILMDWDRSGQKLQDRLSQEMAGAWEQHSDLRRMLKILCQKEVKDIEGIPGLIRRLSTHAIAGTEG